MSSPSTAFPLIQPLLDQGKRPLVERLKAFLWVIGQLAVAVPRSFAVWTVIAILQGLMPPFQLWASGQLVDAIQQNSRDGGGHPWLWAAAMAAALASVRVLSPLMNWAEVGIHERGVALLRGRVLSQATAVDLELLEYQQFYDVTIRIAEESDQGLKESLKALKDLVTNGIPLLGAVLIVAAIDWRLMLVLMLPLLPIVLEAMRQGGFVWDALRGQTHDRRIAQYIANRFSDRQSAKEIRLFGISEELISRWQHHYLHTRKELRGKTTRAALRMQLTGTWADLITYGGLIWLITGSSVSTSAADITVIMGAFMTSGNQTFGLQQALMSLGNRSGLASDIRSFLLLPGPWSTTDSPAHSASEISIEMENVSFAYPGTNANVIDGINLRIQPGESIAIVGENGAGKTTLLKLILGLYSPTGGRILINGRPMESIPIDERQTMISAVFQTFNRYPETLRANIVLPAEADENRLSQVIRESGLENVIANAPNGLDTIASPDLGGVDLSGGQWQRMAIARAAYKDAAILALDEPTAALDPLAEVDVFRRFANLRHGRTTILISHRLGMARLADRIIVIENGKLSEDGSHNDLIRNRGHYAELWEMQSRWYH